MSECRYGQKHHRDKRGQTAYKKMCIRDRELHKIGGRWYIYVAADDGDNYHHRMYVLGCTGENPTDKYEMLGKITDKTDKWAIDGTVLRYNGCLLYTSARTRRSTL